MPQTDQERVLRLRKSGMQNIDIAAVLGVDVAVVNDTLTIPDAAAPLPLGPNAQIPTGDGGGSDVPWRTFQAGSGGDGMLWNGWHAQDGDHPILFRKIGTTVEMTGIASGGVAASGNAIGRLPSDLWPAADVFFAADDLRVRDDGYLVMIDGDGAPFDLSVVTYEAAS